MTRDEDARATWGLLTNDERKVLAAIGSSACVMTPHETGRGAGMTWQAAVRHARALKTLGLVTVTSLPKQTSYKLSGQGEACLALGRAAGESPSRCPGCGSWLWGAEEAASHQRIRGLYPSVCQEARP
jgi:hypothetical protein